jgi:hypothetical protein
MLVNSPVTVRTVLTYQIECHEHPGDESGQYQDSDGERIDIAVDTLQKVHLLPFPSPSACLDDRHFCPCRRDCLLYQRLFPFAGLHSNS